MIVVPSINWPQIYFEVLASAQGSVYSPYNIDDIDIMNMERVFPHDYPLYLGSYISPEFEDMVKSL